MQALGLIETKGLLAAVESADAMLKAAEVKLVSKTLTGGGLVTVIVMGETAAASASVDAGAAAVGRIGAGFLVSTHVIPRPVPDLEWLVAPGCAESGATATIGGFDKLARESGIESAKDYLKKCKVPELRSMARKCDGFGIAGRAISEANKETLLAEFEKYYLIKGKTIK
ncbi:MAG: BMC domain-containing protein [Clostridiales bacterium]|nr:BMC domain-containing protein [Clostridiales bacterium]